MKNLVTFEEFLNENLSKKELEDKVKTFLKKYPDGNIPDADVYKLSDDLKVNTHELESIFYMFASRYVNESNSVIGGKGDTTKESDVNQEELQVGMAVEKEHTNDASIAKEIALDHLTENPKYYSELVAKGIVDEKDALELAKKIQLENMKNLQTYDEFLNEEVGFNFAGATSFPDKMYWFKEEDIYRYIGYNTNLDRDLFVGNFAHGSDPKNRFNTYFLYAPDKIDLDLAKRNKFKADEYLFRVDTQLMRSGKVSNLVKINLNKMLVYFNVTSDFGDETVQFDTKGSKISYMHLLIGSEKMFKK